MSIHSIEDKVRRNVLEHNNKKIGRDAEKRTGMQQTRVDCNSAYHRVAKKHGWELGIELIVYETTGNFLLKGIPAFVKDIVRKLIQDKVIEVSSTRVV
jgi:hypothetical protein